MTTSKSEEKPIELEDIENYQPEPFTLDDLTEDEITIDPDAREALRNWKGILPEDSVESLDTGQKGLIDKSRVKLGRSLMSGPLEATYALGVTGGSFVANIEAARLGLDAIGASGSLAEWGAAAAVTGSFVATTPAILRSAGNIKTSAVEAIMPKENGGEYGHMLQGGYEDEMAELLEEVDANEYFELKGTTYEMDAGAADNMRYLGTVEEDLYYTIGWEYDEDQDRTFVELDALVLWDPEPIDLDELDFDLDSFDMWRFRGTKEAHPNDWDQLKSLITRAEASEDEVMDYFDEAYDVLDESGYLKKNSPYEKSSHWEGRRRGYNRVTTLDDSSRPEY